MKGAIYYKPT